MLVYKGFVMSIHTGEALKGITINLDGNTFRDCVFTDCHIIYSGGEYGDGFTTESCTWELRGSALRTLNFIRDHHIPASK